MSSAKKKLTQTLTSEDEELLVNYKVQPEQQSELPINPWLDGALQLKRGHAEVKVLPRREMCTGYDGYIHFSLPLTIAEEAAYWALDEEHAVPAQISVSLLRPAHVNNGPIIGFGDRIRKGASVLTATGSAIQGGKQICHVTVTFIKFEKR